MKIVKLKKHILALCFLDLFLTITIGKAVAATYYIATNGSDSNDGSITSAWGTFAYAMTKLQPGDILIIKDGTYHQSLNITVSGIPGKPISFRTQNDGKVIIDGQRTRVPFIIDQRPGRVHDIIVDGIRFQNSNWHVVAVISADRVTLKRASAYHAGEDNSHVYAIVNSNDILLEDCAASGSGRQMYVPFSSDRVTFRRCWARWQSHSGGGGPNGILEVYGSNDNIVENLVATMDQSSETVQGLGVWANAGQIANRNKLYGNIIYGLNSWAFFNSSAIHRIEGNRFKDNVGIDNSWGVAVTADADFQIGNMTITGTPQQSLSIYETPIVKDDEYKIKGSIRNSILLSGGVGFKAETSPNFISFVSEYNNVYNLSIPYSGVAAKGTGDISVNPELNITKYGKGGYLFVPENSPVKKAGEGGLQMGAEVLYRYQDGELTNIPLWPWPMEERIFDETGISVTWEANGGLWKTLDGIYSENPSAFDFVLSHSGNVSATPGSSTFITINTNLRSGAPELVSYSVSGLPTGATASFSPSSCLPNCSITLTINISASTPDGAYAITVTGATAKVSRNTRFSLTVKASSENSINALHTLTPITIDGILSEDAWNRTAHVTFSNPARSDNQVKVYTLWNNNYLYFAYVVKDSELEAQNQTYWQDDGAEIFLDTENDKTTNMNSNDHHFIININDQAQPTGINVRTATKPDGYVMELSIPWVLINTTPSLGKTMGLLLAINDRDNGTSVQFDWLGLIETGSYARPNLWGDIVLSNKQAGSRDSVPPLPPTNVKVIVSNP